MKGRETMVIPYSILYIALIIALLVCTAIAKRSDRQGHNAVCWLESSLIIPILGNWLAIISEKKMIALIGYYLYFLGIDLVLTSLVNFTDQYCKGTGNGTHKPIVMYLILAADAVQLLLNPFFRHAFDIGTITTDMGTSYHQLLIYSGQKIHHIIDYSVLFCVVLIFLISSIVTPKIYRERFTVLLVSIVMIGIVQAHYIFITNTYDRSVIGYGILGFLIFYFSICYRPLRLLDQLLSNIVSNLSDAFYIFDSNGKCIWANEQGCELVGFKGNNYEQINAELINMFGEISQYDKQIIKKSVENGNDIHFYTLEEKQVKASNGKSNGSYLRIQDITKEELELKARDKQIGKISYEAYKDALTGVGNKSLYNKKVNEMNKNIANGLNEFAVIMVDINNLKRINDEYGHKAGDIYIKGCCQIICRIFSNESIFRIGGDEFAVILQGKDFTERFQAVEELRSLYDKSFKQTGSEEWLRYSASVGIAEYASDDNSFELVFKRADKAMYEEKKNFKKLYGSYR